MSENSEEIQETDEQIINDMREKYAQLLEIIETPERQSDQSPNQKQGSALNLDEMTLFKHLPPTLYTLRQLMEQKRAQEPERFANMTLAQVTRDLTDEEILETANARRDGEDTWLKHPEEDDQADNPFYTVDDPNIISRKFWPGTQCRLLKRLTAGPTGAYHNPEAEDRVSETNRAFTIYRIIKAATKRIIMPNRQFAVFNDHAHDEMPEGAFADLRWPFDDDIYVEFDEPFTSSVEDENITLEGFLVTGEGTARTVSFALFEDDHYVMRTMDMDLTTGVEVLPPHYYDDVPDQILPKAISMTMAYMTARGMKLVEEPLPRNLRRQVERNKIPNPWHVIRAEHPGPRYAPSDEPAAGSTHSYRYDVIGHFRIRQYQLADGTYRTKRSWVRPHQRGLKNEHYLPGTRRFQSSHPNESNELAAR